MKKTTLKKFGSRIAEDNPLLVHVKALADEVNMSINGNVQVTIHMIKNKDGSFVMRTSKSAPVKKMANASRATGVERKNKINSFYQKSLVAHKAQPVIMRSTVLVEESLEETQAIARNIEDNLQMNKEFYQYLKRLATS